MCDIYRRFPSAFSHLSVSAKLISLPSRSHRTLTGLTIHPSKPPGLPSSIHPYSEKGSATICGCIPFIARTFSHTLTCPTRPPGTATRMGSFLKRFFQTNVSGKGKRVVYRVRLLFVFFLLLCSSPFVYLRHSGVHPEQEADVVV